MKKLTLNPLSKLVLGATVCGMFYTLGASSHGGGEEGRPASLPPPRPPVATHTVTLARMVPILTSDCRKAIVEAGQLANLTQEIYSTTPSLETILSDMSVAIDIKDQKAINKAATEISHIDWSTDNNYSALYEAKNSFKESWTTCQKEIH